VCSQYSRGTIAKGERKGRNKMIDVNGKAKRVPFPPWLIPNSPEWNKVMMHSQKMLGMTYQESLQDLMERREAALREEERK